MALLVISVTKVASHSLFVSISLIAGTDGLHRAGLHRSVARTILTMADQVDTQLIVIGLHGQGSPLAHTLGRVVQQVLLGARIPVQVVPCGVARPTSDRWGGAMGRIN